MQGTAADIIKRAMIRLHGWIKGQHDLDITMIMQVHDELVFEVAESQIEEAGTRVRNSMVEAAALRAPLVVDIGVGKNWDEAH
jgi:DNA polymerase-1